MIQVESIELITDQKTYTIKKHQVEEYPFQGGTSSNQITTKVWNQHGNTFVDSFMEPLDTSLTFGIFYGGKEIAEVASMHREITDVCNPLNGIVEMKVTLNTGEIYSRDISFTTTPQFPVGFENRNREFQKVRLEYEVHDPFWYSERDIVETFQSVDPLFEFPFTMSTGDPVEFGSLLPANIATNQGQVEAPVSIRITGICTNPRIENKTTGEFIKLNNFSMGENETLVIDTAFGQKKVELDGVSMFHKLDTASTFFTLKKGENEIEFSDDTNSTTAKIYFTYKELFISI
jgi:hypothetical protein